ncbi:MAG: hypothetical protein JXA54_09200 [Candidatus Heimdallarchaeota archaeon]|nr:hypothetical protein [Candidatus Heimdallarchaeota archaeon]
MYHLFESFIERFPTDIQDRLNSAVMEQSDLNPNDRLHKGVHVVLKEVLLAIEELKNKIALITHGTKKGYFGKGKIKKDKRNQYKILSSEISLKEEISFQLASLGCYLIHSLKVTDDFISSLRKINHPYIELFITYFKEDPSNYQETREKIDSLIGILEKHQLYTDEMKAFVLGIKSWIYGVIGDIVILKEIYKYLYDKFPRTNNIIEIRGLQDAATNVIWWMLHSGAEANIEEMITFVEPFFDKYTLYMSKTDFLNLQGAIYSYFGDNKQSIRKFEELKEVHEKFYDNYRLSIAIGNLAESYFIEGKILLAKEMMEKAISLYKESTGRWPYLYLTEIGNMYFLTGDIRAEESFLHAYEIQKKETTMFKAFILFELIHFYLRTEQLDKANKFIIELKNLTKELEAISINAQIDYLLGYIEMLEQNFSYAIKLMHNALELAQLAKDFDLILSCNIQLAAIYLQRYRLNEQQSFLNSTLNHLDTAIQFAIENHHTQILSIGLVVRALLSASKGEYDNAFQDLIKVKDIINEIDYDNWKRELMQFEEKIIQAEKKGKMELDQESIFQYILPQFKSMLSFKLAERKPIKSEVIGLFVISESGVPVYTKLGKSLNADKMILSGLLTAVNHLSESVVEGKDKGRLREVLYEKFWITIQPIKNGLVALIATEATAEVRSWANTIAARIVEVPIVISEMTNELEVYIKDIIMQMNIK